MAYLDETGLARFWYDIKQWIASALSNLVHRTGHESITGRKLFVSHQTYDQQDGWNLASRVIVKSEDITRGVTPAETKYISFDFEDSTYDVANDQGDGNPRLASIEYAQYSTGAYVHKLFATNHSDLTDAAALRVGFDQNGIKFADVPSTSSQRNSGTDIVTRDWIPNDTRIVHTTGNETIGGTKTFTSSIYVDRAGSAFVSTNPNFVMGQNPSADTSNLIWFADANGTGYSDLEGLARANGETLLRLSVRENKASDYDSVALEINYPASGAPYAWCPSTPDPTSANLDGRTYNKSGNTDILTRDWIPRDTRIVHTTGNEVISGTKTFSDPIVLDQTTLKMRVLQSDNTYRTDEIIYGNSQGTNNINLAIGGKGNMIVASGECGRTQLDALAGDYGERLYLCSDSLIYFKTNCGTGLDASKEIVLDTNNRFYGLGHLGIADFDLTAKGTNPSVDQWTTISFSDATCDTATSHRLGAVEALVDTNGLTATVLRAYNWVSGNSSNARMGIFYPKNGTAYTEAPTPDASDNSTKIATTAWTRTFAGNTYLPLSGGTMSGIITRNGGLAQSGSTSGSISIYNGTGASGGGGIWMYGKDNGAHGEVRIQAYNGTYRQLNCLSDGTLKWNGQTVQTSSDERLKTPMSDVPDEVLDAWGGVRWGQFQFLDAVEEKGSSARLHVGLIAQAVDRTFASENLDVCRYGILCHEVRGAEGEVPAVEQWMARYTEALCMEAAYQRRENARLKKRVADLEERLAALELRLGSE